MYPNWHNPKDKQSLTILVTLSEQASYEGGGTAFYADDELCLGLSVLPKLVVAPPVR